MSQSQAFCTLYELFFHGYSGKYTSDFCVNETVTLALDYHKPHRAIQCSLPKVKCKSCFYQSKKKTEPTTPWSYNRTHFNHI